MAEPTTRDRVWIMAIANLVGGGDPVTPAFLAEDIRADCSERTARDVLKVMSQEGFVDEDRMADGTVRYQPIGILDVER